MLLWGEMFRNSEIDALLLDLCHSHQIPPEAHATSGLLELNLRDEQHRPWIPLGAHGVRYDMSVKHIGQVAPRARMWRSDEKVGVGDHKLGDLSMTIVGISHCSDWRENFTFFSSSHVLPYKTFRKE